MFKDRVQNINGVDVNFRLLYNLPKLGLNDYSNHLFTPTKMIYTLFASFEKMGKIVEVNCSISIPVRERIDKNLLKSMFIEVIEKVKNKIDEFETENKDVVDWNEFNIEALL